MIRHVAAVVLSAAFLGVGATPAPDARHLRLERSTPAADTTITESPATIQLWFNQPPQIAVSRISLSQGGEDVEIGETRAGSENSLVADVPAPLSSGDYTVNWRAAGNDGHVLRDDFDFTLASTDNRR